MLGTGLMFSVQASSNVGTTVLYLRSAHFPSMFDYTIRIGYEHSHVVIFDSIKCLAILGVLVLEFSNF